MKRVVIRPYWSLNLLAILAVFNAQILAEGAANQLPVLNKWFALGSGCKASSEVKGDVFAETRSPSADVNQMRFSIPHYKLDIAANTVLPGNKPEAKECALRVNVNPPPNKRVKFVTATTSLSESKAAGVELTSFTELKIGTDTLHRNVQQYAASDSFSNRVRQAQMIPGSKPEEVFPKLECGQAKIIAINMTFLAKRSDKSQSAKIELANSKTLELVVDLEDCKP